MFFFCQICVKMLPHICRHGWHTLPTELRHQLSMPQEHTGWVGSTHPSLSTNFLRCKICLLNKLWVIHLQWPNCRLHAEQVADWREPGSQDVSRFVQGVWNHNGRPQGMSRCYQILIHLQLFLFKILSEKITELPLWCRRFWAMISTMTTSTPVSMVRCRMSCWSLTLSWGSCYFPCHRGR
jgi:hypothetical protein